MKRIKFLSIIVAVPAMIFAASNGNAAQPYQPVVPQSTVVAGGYGGWSGNTGASTAAGSAMNGMAGVISAQGERNLSNSAAAVNWTQAQKNEIENRQQWTDTYFQMRETNRAFREKERAPRPTPEDMVRFAQWGKPKPLTPSQLNPDGRVAWPSVLTTDTFAENRQKIDAVLVKRAEQGGLGFQDLMEFRNLTTAMLDQLKEIIRDVPPPMYMAAKDFLNSLAYAVQKTG